MKTLKICLIYAIFCLNLNAEQTQELYQKALEFEKSGDILQAMKYYKLAAQNKINAKEKMSEDEKFIAISQASEFDPPKDKNSQKEISKSYKDKDSYNIDEILGIKTHNLNYLLPASVAFKHIDGRRRFETNFQLSIQKPLTYDIFGLNETVSFGYSQESWWQTAKSSTPFRETNYRPEIFITFPTELKFWQNLDYLRFGLLHESNGQGGENSRSWNRIYAQTKFSIGDLTITPRAWFRLPDTDGKDDNPHIQDHIGRADVTLTYKVKDHFITAMVRNNLKFDTTNKGAFELGWLFPISNLGLHGYIKYFSGYGESLIDYNRHTNKIGLGFAILK